MVFQIVFVMANYNVGDMADLITDLYISDMFETLEAAELDFVAHFNKLEYDQISVSDDIAGRVADIMNLNELSFKFVVKEK